MLLMVCFVQTVMHAEAQIDSLRALDPIQVIARPSADSIVLRWAPVETRYWLATNKQGYVIERYTLVRDGKSLPEPEKKIITTIPLKPYTEAQWERIVNNSNNNNKYAAIAAQALLGETFQLDMQQGSAATIVNKVSENEQRFSIALYCADLSVVTAKALALYYTDKDVKKGERYLYRIISGDTKSTAMIRGSVFTSPDDPYQLPAPLKFSAEVKDNVAMLRWNQSYHKRIYTAYIVERSADGKNFTPLSEDPVSTLSPTAVEETEFQYASDSVKDISKEYHYRVRGMTPFGETGPPSEAKTVKGKRTITDLPYITSAVSADNKIITLHWEFPQEHNTWIEGFYIERSASPSGTFSKAHNDLLAKEARSFKDLSPHQTNYYRITAQTTDKELIRSMTYYAQLVDSIPPAPPAGLKGVVDEHGNVTLSWTPNAEKDIYGYRVYRAYYASQEFSQLTDGPVRDIRFNDKVMLESLNDKVHYRVMAIDINQNHSSLSDVYSLSLPDKLPPVAPVFLPVKSKEDGVELTWMPGSSEDVVKYELYRKGDSNEWMRLTTIAASADTLFRYTDTGLKNNELRYYTVVAVDEANLESPPAAVVTGQKLKRRIWPAVELQAPEIDRVNNKTILRWSYNESEVKLFQIYKSANDEPLKLYRSVLVNEFTDRMYSGKYHYRVVAVFMDGSRSEMGQGVSVAY